MTIAVDRDVTNQTKQTKLIDCSYQFLLLSLFLGRVFAISSDGYCVIAIA